MADRVMAYPNLEGLVEMIKERNKLLDEIFIKPKRKLTEMEAISKISDWIGVSPSILIGIPIPDLEVEFGINTFKMAGSLLSKDKVGSYTNPELKNRKILPDIGKGNIKSVLDTVMNNYIKYKGGK